MINNIILLNLLNDQRVAVLVKLYKQNPFQVVEVCRGINFEIEAAQHVELFRSNLVTLNKNNLILKLNFL